VSASWLGVGEHAIERILVGQLLDFGEVQPQVFHQLRTRHLPIRLPPRRHLQHKHQHPVQHQYVQAVLDLLRLPQIRYLLQPLLQLRPLPTKGL
jgi:hypothetical protein